MITAEAIDPASEKEGEFASASSAPSASASKSNLANGFAASNPRTQTDDADASRLDADGTDGNFTARSGQAGGGTPFLITHDMRRRLHELGYRDEAIRAMTPVDALRLLDGAKPDNNPIDDLMPGAEVAF